MSNALLVAAKKSVSKHPIFVAGPQVGFYWPEFLLELDMHGGGIDTRGASFPGIGYVVIGRGKDYAWSAMSSHSDIVDSFVETLCGGDDLHYLYKGECRAMGTFDAGLLKGRGDIPDQQLTFHTTVHGPVIGYATVGGTKVAISHERSTYGRELASALAFADLDRNKVTSAKSFFTVMNQEEFSFNWVYADNKDIAFFSAARLPKRAAGVDIGLPAIGTGQYDWQGVEPLGAHARGNESAERLHPRLEQPAGQGLLGPGRRVVMGIGAARAAPPEGALALQEAQRRERRRRDEPGGDTGSAGRARLADGQGDARKANSSADRECSRPGDRRHPGRLAAPAVQAGWTVTWTGRSTIQVPR